MAEGLAYGPRVALVVVDCQNDFADPAGSLYVPGGPDIVGVANREIAAARAAGARVVLTQDWHPAETSHFAAFGGVWPVHCVAGTWGAAFHPDLDARGEVVRKGVGGEDGYSGFTMRDPVSGHDCPTRLAATLHASGVRTVVLIGLATDYCVRASGLDARRLGLGVVVVREGVGAVDLQPGDGERALAELAAAGAEVV